MFIYIVNIVDNIRQYCKKKKIYTTLIVYCLGKKIFLNPYIPAALLITDDRLAEIGLKKKKY